MNSNKYMTIRQMLKTIFNVDFGFPEAMQRELYVNAVVQSNLVEIIKAEFEQAMNDENFSWLEMRIEICFLIKNHYSYFEL